MLSSLKEKLISVQDGIVSSLIRDETSYRCDGTDYIAGFHLLMKFQQDWQGIHALSEQNARQAKAVDEQINDVYSLIKHNAHTVKKLSSDVQDFNNIVTLAEKAVNAIGNIRTLSEEVHKKIVELENLLEQDRQTNAILDAKDRLSNHRKEKLMSLDAIREKLAKEYKVRLKVISEEKDEMKRKNFELAEKRFLEDLNAYKETGILPKRDNLESQMMRIEDVEIEQDLDSLQEYLDE